MKKFPCEAFDYASGGTGPPVRLASEALLSGRVNLNDHDLKLHREIARLKVRVRDLKRRVVRDDALFRRLWNLP